MAFKKIAEKLSVRDCLPAQIKKFKELQGNPGYLSRGIAVGVFIGFAPVMPLKSILIITLTILLSGSTIAGLLICTLICNPLTYIPLYYMAWYVGDLLLPGRASWEVLHATMLEMQGSSLTNALLLAAQIGFDTVVVMLTGGCMIAFFFTILSYPISYRLFKDIKLIG